MAYEMKEATGSLFKNDEKTDETHADFNGSCLIKGVEYWVNAWVHVYTKDGQQRKYFKLSFRPKQQAAAKTTGGSISDMESDIPFAPIGRGISGHAE